MRSQENIPVCVYSTDNNALLSVYFLFSCYFQRGLVPYTFLEPLDIVTMTSKPIQVQ